MVRVMRLLYRALGRGRGIALGSRSNSDWDGAASPPTTFQPVQPRLGPEPLEDLASSASILSASSCFPSDASQLPCSSNVIAFEHAFALGSELDVQGGRMLYIHLTRTSAWTAGPASRSVR